MAAATGAIDIETVVQASFACPPGIAAGIAGKARLRRHAARATILWQGERASEVFLLLAGEAHALFAAANGQEMRLHVHQPGDLFGEAGVLTGEAAGESVVAVCDSATAAFGSGDFVLLVETHACIGLALSRRLIARQAAMTRRLTEQSILSATGRICAELARQGRAGNGRIAPVPVLSDLARELQTTRETVSRTLGDLKRRGIIRQDGDALVLVAARMLDDLVV
jgi:CRP/FNR family cyclic AMP-dependent transcriptional regulator